MGSSRKRWREKKVKNDEKKGKVERKIKRK